MYKDFLETSVGGVVLLIAALFLYYGYGITNTVSSSDVYKIHARFARIDGLNMGGDVKIAGINVGKVTGQSLDEKTFHAVLEMSIANNIKVPVDTSAEIVGNGLLGEKYVSLLPGSEDDMLQDGGAIEFTQSSISLESMIGKFMFGADKQPSDAKK